MVGFENMQTNNIVQNEQTAFMHLGIHMHTQMFVTTTNENRAHKFGREQRKGIWEGL